MVVVTPRLEEEFRYDQYWEKLGNGADLTSFDAGKGLELIPTTSNEVILNLPPYIDRTIKKPAEGLPTAAPTSRRRKVLLVLEPELSHWPRPRSQMPAAGSAPRPSWPHR